MIKSGPVKLAAGVFVSLTIFAVIAFAAPVSEAMATRAATTHLAATRDIQFDGRCSIGSISELRHPETDQLLGYVAELAPHGFVIISADTRISPVIAYSYRSNLSWEDIPENTLLHMVRTDLHLRIKVFKNQIMSATDHPDWKAYVSGNVMLAVDQWPSPGSTSTGGWVETTWNQRSPYNNYCPLDPRNSQRCVVGCVATAMSQIIDYHSERRDYMGKAQLEAWNRYVSDYTDPAIYIDEDATALDFPDFETMNDYLLTLREHYVDNAALTNSDLATLAFMCGITTKMHYSSGGSGTGMNLVATALLFKFEYQSAMLMSGGLVWFYDTLSNNMKDSLPAELAIYQSGWVNGHAIVCDGLREIDGQDDEYHLNFGWGPNQPDPIGTAWYVLPEGMPVGYSIVNSGVVCIYPPEKSYQPDNLISKASDAGFVGDDIYSDDGPQEVTFDADFNTTTTYYIKVQNDGNLDQEIRVTAEETGNSSWQVAYFVDESNQDITAKITASGWVTGEFEPDGEVLLRMEITVPADASMEEIYTVDVTSTSEEDEEFLDVVSIATSAAVAERSSPAPESFISTSSHPSSTVEFTYGLSAPIKVRVSVYDVNGRLVKNLVNEHVPAGYHHLTWDGRDNLDTPVSRGTYFCVLEAGERIYSTRAVFVR